MFGVLRTALEILCADEERSESDDGGGLVTTVTVVLLLLLPRGDDTAAVGCRERRIYQDIQYFLFCSRKVQN